MTRRAIEPSWILMPNRIDAGTGWADPPLAARAHPISPTSPHFTPLALLGAILVALAWLVATQVLRFRRHLVSRIRANFGGIGADFKRRLAAQAGRLLPINTLCFVGG